MLITQSEKNGADGSTSPLQPSTPQIHIFGHAAPWRTEDILREFKISRRTLTNWKARRIIGYYRVGRTIFFDPQEVRNAVFKRRVEPRPGISAGTESKGGG